MAAAEFKKQDSLCPRCGKPFECKATDIFKCECYGFKVREAAARLISEKYSDCLCMQCLQELNQHPALFDDQSSPAE